MGEVAEIVGGGTPSTNISKYWNGNINWYSPTEIGSQTFVNSSKKKITELGLKESSAKLLPGKKTILFTSRAGIGDMAIMNTDGSTNQGFQSWIVKPDITDIYFLYSLGCNLKKQALRKASGSTFLEISNSEVKKLSLYLPDFKEQTIIGKIIQLIDKIITLQQRKLSELINLRLGILHAVFDNNKSNKKQIILSELGTTYSGLTNKTKTDFGHGAAHYVTYINVNKNPIADPREIANIEIDTNQNSVKKGDIFFTISSETPEEVGLTSVWPINIQNTYLNSFCFGFRPYSNKIDSFYLGYLFRSDYFRRKIYPLAQGISRYNLSKNNVLKLMIKVDSLEKQYKIKKILLNIDFKIKKEKEKINKVKQLKQFLLQNMFI